MKTTIALSVGLALFASAGAEEELTPFSAALRGAGAAIESGDLVKAKSLIDRALERDAKSVDAWAVRARWAEAVDERDELAYSLHRELRLAIAQDFPRADIDARRARLLELDPMASTLLDMTRKFIAELQPIAAQYEKDGRPHSAIRIHSEILALDPEHVPSLEAIDRISALPDPSLAEHAKPRDLLADVSDEWIREHDAEHDTWENKASLERENYTTYTDAGYEVLVRCAEAMEQMNAFYRVFFQYGHDGKRSISRIDLNIFKSRDEYLELGIGPPVEWSGGHFTGSAVETYAEGGFSNLTGTLFHEAAHQFVSLATNAAGWLNEGLASFFEGCRILPNGTVLMNMPANHRLFPTVARMERGWMSSAADGTSADDPNQTPEKAPTFRIVLENRYSWGPPWYGPTWAVVYFLYNYQDPIDGRFVYRDAFRVFVDKSGGRMGEGAVENFEEIVLGNPSKPLKGVERDASDEKIALPKTVEELDPVWKNWLIELREQQMGRLSKTYPYQQWAEYAVANKNPVAAMDHYEKGLIQSPRDIALLRSFAEFLMDQDNHDRATKLLLEAVRLVESMDEIDEEYLREIDRLLEKCDPKKRTLQRIQEQLWVDAKALVEGYRDAGLPMMVMDVSRRLGTELNVPGLMSYYEEAMRSSGKSLDIWQLAYNEQTLEGWDATDETFEANGIFIDSSFGEYASDAFTFTSLGLDKVTGGDFSLQADVEANRGEVNFCGLVFGRKDAQSYHALILFPGKPDDKSVSGVAKSAFVDLTSFYGGNSQKIWRHNPLTIDEDEEQTKTGTWHTLRVDVVGNVVDAWVDGELIATQTFPSRDVLFGGFGLVTGPGSARFKEVRYLERLAGDPAAELEREVKLEQLKAQGGVAVGGSYQDQVPPFPKVGRWVQSPRKSWDEKGPVPQVLILWSIQQNEIVRIDEWVGDLARDYADVGLEIVSVCSPNDEEQIEAYLEKHPFPGSLAVDFREGAGIGDSNKMFFTHRFNLPRILLLDVDQKVVWEGDPGISAAEPYVPGFETYLKDPLQTLIVGRRLKKLAGWLESWKARGGAALHDGDLADAAPLLRESLAFDGSVVVEVYEAQRVLDAVTAAVTDLPASATLLGEQERDPALRVLLEWAPMLDVELTASTHKSLKKFTDSKPMKEWDRALKQLASGRKKVEKDPNEAVVLADRLEKLAGAFPVEIADRLRSAAPAGDVDALLAIIDTAPDAPKLWLAQRHFGW
jgi:tetratricopeptide (TPR) repeat protein